MNNTYKATVLSTLKRKANRRISKKFTGYELVEGWTGLRYSSAMRALRQMKTEGTIDYICTNPAQSEYKLLSIND